MKLFLTLEKAKKEQSELTHYIDLIENYEPQTLQQEAILLYAKEGSLAKVAFILNDLHKTGDDNRVELTTVKEWITTRPAPHDHLHKIIKTLFLKRGRANRAKTKNSSLYW